MIVKSLEINNLRNIESARIDAHPEANFLVGANGSGKTSVLESLVVLAKGRSFRSGQISSLIGPVAETLSVIARTQKSNAGESVLGFERGVNHWRARLNGTSLEQLGAMASEIPLVLIEPNSHLLISGSPEHRRRYLDWGVFHVEHAHLLSWRRYNKALKQRNAALRLKQAEVVRSLDPVLIELGERLHEARSALFENLEQMIDEHIAVLSPALGSVTLKYKKGWSADTLAENLDSAHLRDMERGHTGSGPHRADIEILYQQEPAKERLSRGEQKILSSALLLTQAKIIAERNQPPLLLLDDLSSEFDVNHLSAVMGFGEDLKSQTWVTGTSLEPYEGICRTSRQVFHVEQGKIFKKTTT